MTSLFIREIANDGKNTLNASRRLSSGKDEVRDRCNFTRKVNFASKIPIRPNICHQSEADRNAEEVMSAAATHPKKPLLRAPRGKRFPPVGPN